MDEFIVLTPDPKEAHSFYYQYIFQENLQLEFLCKKYNFESKAPYSWKWELFGAILVGDKRKKLLLEDSDKREHKGADLLNHEIKSSGEGSAFEYQYHPESWQDKLREDRRVTHIYVSYSEDYKDITVRALEGSKLENYFKEWEPELAIYWKDETSKKITNKRFRRHIPYSRVRSEGRIICAIKNTELLYSNNQGMAGDLLLKPKSKRNN